MYWEDDDKQIAFVVPDDVVDLAFRIDCPTLPVDHAAALSRAIAGHLPWFGDDPGAGLHIIHGGESGNGWERPIEGDALLHLSRRTPLVIRVPKARVVEALTLSGTTLDVDGNPMRIGEGKTRLLSRTNTLYARYLFSEAGLDEERFIGYAVGELQRLGLRFKKILAGKSRPLAIPTGIIETRSLMVSDLPFADAVALQERGLGPYRNLGCGLFIAHKSV